MKRPDRGAVPGVRRATLTAGLAALVAGVTGAPAAAESFASLSLEELMRISVTSVAGTEHAWFGTPAALTVLTRDDVRRAGHTSIPEALRLVPGVFVGRTDANTWSIGTRGFNGGFGTKQLVLIDGRITYDPLFSGTFWDVQDVVFEDLERIEVVRGPGATLWGANAVNGVINVTTRAARDAQGLHVRGGGGTHEKLFAEASFGSSAGEAGWYRVWARHFERNDFGLVGGASAADDWDMTRAGFRIDLDSETAMTLQGEVYSSGRIGELVNGQPLDGDAGGYHLLYRASRGDQQTDGWSLQAYADHTDRTVGGGFEVERLTLDVDLRRYASPFDGHALVAGVGYRHSSDDTVPTALLRYRPSSRSSATVSAFVQDTVTLRADRVFAMVGSKFEHNDFSGFELQPSARIWWTPDEATTLWGAVSRPVRTPSRTDEDLAVLIPGVFEFEGNPGLDSEALTAWEVGYRARLTSGLTLDVAGFYNEYRNLIATTGLPTNLSFDNAGSARSHGFEIAAEWRLGDIWQFAASYSHLEVDAGGAPVDAPETSSPRHLAQLRANANLTERLQANGAVYYSGRVPLGDVDAHVRVDAGLRWRPRAGLEVAAWVQNLLDDAHVEYVGSAPVEVPRAAYVGVSLRH